MTSYLGEKHVCGGCGKEVDTLTHTDRDGEEPGDGDIAICAYCGQIDLLSLVDGTLVRSEPSLGAFIDLAASSEIEPPEIVRLILLSISLRRDFKTKGATSELRSDHD